MSSEPPHVVILAGGSGTRLAPLTRALYGNDLPKQFAVLAGRRSLLQDTVARARTLAPAGRISVVVTASHAQIARAQLVDEPGVELVVQPANLDTAPGILVPIARILARSWSARVIFLPSDHYIANWGPIALALQSLGRGALARRLALVGVAPVGPELEYGWIAPGRAIAGTGAHEIAAFREKPDEAEAERLFRGGCLWNTFILGGPARIFWELAHAHLPIHAAAFERYALALGGPDEAPVLDRIFQTLRPANFSRDVLAHAERLAVVPVAGSGWSDWGSPQRVFASLAGTPDHERLVERIRGPALAG